MTTLPKPAPVAQYPNTSGIFSNRYSRSMTGSHASWQAAAVLHQAIDVIELTWGGGGLTIVFGACRELQRWRQVAAVQDVYDRVMALLSA